jgi:hypothetical protein
MEINFFPDPATERITDLLVLAGDFSGCRHHLFRDLEEIFQSGGRDDHIVTTAVHDLGDAQEAAARILFQGKDESLSFDLNGFSF